MADIHKLMRKLASQEKLLLETEFLAPCVKRGQVRTSIEKIIYTMNPQPEDFEGWGIFKSVNPKTAEMIEEASLPQIAEYLGLLKPLRLRLAYSLEGKSWLAYPINESDMHQRFGNIKPVVVHLVDEGARFEVIIARRDGNCWWYEDIDRRSDSMIADKLNEFFRDETKTEKVHFSGMTPEMLTIYDLALQNTANYRQGREYGLEIRDNTGKQDKEILFGENESQASSERRLQKALHQGGGMLERFRDRGDFWQVEWKTGDGEFHSSAINKNDLTVISSGICLSGRDRDFDLQSLVGVMENQYDW